MRASCALHVWGGALAQVLNFRFFKCECTSAPRRRVRDSVCVLRAVRARRHMSGLYMVPASSSSPSPSSSPSSAYLITRTMACGCGDQGVATHHVKYPAGSNKKRHTTTASQEGVRVVQGHVSHSLGHRGHGAATPPCRLHPGHLLHHRIVRNHVLTNGSTD